MNNLKKLNSILFENSIIINRLMQSNASLLENITEIQNRNPRNLELMTIAKKPIGYALDLGSHHYWNRLTISVTGKHIDAEVHHFNHGSIITVSTKEWALKKYLFSKSHNISVFSNLGKILARRCLECGITSVFCDIDASKSKRYSAFLKEIKESGIQLEEPKQYKHAAPQDCYRMIKPWAIEE